jgi:acyl-CoA reductase-like NAD-dependent aldehyde dehydrogenase
LPRATGAWCRRAGQAVWRRIALYIEPFIIADVDNASKTEQEEIFGLILAVIRARDFDHAVEIANYTR